MSFLRHEEEYDYFGAFQRCARYAGEAAAYLDTVAAAFDAAQMPRQVEEMHKIEHAADSIKHEMIHKLAHEFITPIEREDIAALSQTLDDVVDAIEEVVRRAYMYNVTSLRSETQEFASLIVQCCRKLESVLQEFRNFKKSKNISRYIIEINTLESAGDTLYARAVRRLFTQETHAGTQMIWTMLFDAMEECLDACEDAADIIESIIMKNS